MSNWYKEHSPAIFIFSVLSLGVLLIIVSNSIQGSNEFLLIIKPILAGIGGTFTAGGIATLFLNLPNTREYISNTISNLFVTGDIISSLTNEHKAFLKKKIISDEIKNSTEKIEVGLYEMINSIQKNCQTDFHLHNYIVDFTVVDSEKYNDLVEEEQYVSYRVIADHLPVSHNKMFELVLEYHSPVLDNEDLVKESFIQKFNLKMGDSYYEKKDLEISEFFIAELKHFKYRFAGKVKIEDSLDIEIKAKIIKPLIDKSYSLYVRYPTKGYTARLSYKNEYKYVCNWFRYWDKTNSISESILDGKILPNGISAISREWLLPGEGVVLEFH
ncbi:MAG: hypothetical protein MI974_30985 [Chitinophagales bacterium]|nr:hypothetical protein [Chitinophagales bacterium]